MGLKTSIVINFEFEGIHQWEQCPFKDVNFLKTLHRHIFKIKIIKEVSHGDREVEIIRFKRQIKKVFPDGINMGKMSCEQIAKGILQTYDCKYVEVLEDGENGGAVWKE